MLIRINDAQDIIDRSFLPIQCQYLMKSMLEEIVDTRHKHNNHFAEVDRLCQRIAEAESDLNFHKALLEKSASKVKLKELTTENNGLAAENLELIERNNDLSGHINLVRWKDEKVRADELLIKLTALQKEIEGKTAKKSKKSVKKVVKPPRKRPNMPNRPKTAKKGVKMAKT